MMAVPSRPPPDMPSPELTAALYPWVLPAHIGLVGISVALFAVRGLGVLAGGAWPMAAWARHGSALIDTALLAAGLALWWLLQLNPLRSDTWLGVKLLLLVPYIVLGSLALKRAPTRVGKALFFVAALACIGLMAGIAVAHHPLGGLAP
jgi:uncharacterized membrane protein SirB2